MMAAHLINDFAAALGIAAAAIISVGVIWTKGVVPFWRFIHRIAGAIDVLHGIADEFKPNDGTSLVDRLTRMEHTLGETAIRVNENCGRIECIYDWVEAAHPELFDDDDDSTGGHAPPDRA